MCIGEDSTTASLCQKFDNSLKLTNTISAEVNQPVLVAGTKTNVLPLQSVNADTLLLDGKQNYGKRSVSGSHLPFVKRKGILVTNRKIHPVCKKLQVRQQSHRIHRHELDPIQEADDENTLTHMLLPSLTLRRTKVPIDRTRHCPTSMLSMQRLENLAEAIRITLDTCDGLNGYESLLSRTSESSLCASKFHNRCQSTYRFSVGECSHT
jgi:hypothetical protein